MYLHPAAYLPWRSCNMYRARAVCLTRRKPAKQDPDDSAGNNTRKVWCLVHTVGVVKKNDLKNARLVVGDEYPKAYKQICDKSVLRSILQHYRPQSWSWSCAQEITHPRYNYRSGLHPLGHRKASGWTALWEFFPKGDLVLSNPIEACPNGDTHCTRSHNRAFGEFNGIADICSLGLHTGLSAPTLNDLCLAGPSWLKRLFSVGLEEENQETKQWTDVSGVCRVLALFALLSLPT